MANVVSSIIFCARNIDKAENQGRVGRWPVAIAQANNIFKSVKKLDNSLGKGARTASEILQKGAKGEKLLDSTVKGLNVLSKNINPLLCISAGIDVLNSDDKVEAITTNTMSLASMFTVEGLMKKHLDNCIEIGKKGILKAGTTNETLGKIVKSISKTKHSNKISAIVSGVAFVIGSCTAYSVGSKFGELLVVKKENSQNATA